MDLATVLKNAQHPNLEIRSQAEAYLNQAVEAQYGPFLLALCAEFATEGKDFNNRQLAGLFIKNMISAQDEAILEKKVNQWQSCDPALKDQIRLGFLTAIQSNVSVVCHTAAQVLAAFGAVDIPSKTWPNLLPTLFQNINSSTHESCKVASLETLGYMLDAMSPEDVEPAVVNQMLTCIIEGNRPERSPEMRLAAITALNNSIEFASANFEVQNERDALIRAICEATQAKEIKIRERAFECCAEVAEFYYSKLGPYIQVLYELSVQAIRADEATVGMQAIEFWNTVCDQELAITEDIEDGDAEQSELLRIMQQYSPGLTPLLLECMTKQEEDLEDEDNWNISMAAATLLESLSKVICDQVVDLVLPFVTNNINNANWRVKEAAIMAFGMILEGPSGDKLIPLVQQAMPFLINCMKDPKPLVRDTSAWTIGRICELYKGALTAEILPPMVEGLAQALGDNSPKVVSRVCYAVHSLAEACADENEATSNVLSHFMPLMLQKLLIITNKNEIEASNVVTAAYEAINKMVENSAADMQSVVQNLLIEGLNRLERTFNPQLNQNERANVQSSLCSLIGEIVKKLELAAFHTQTDRIMQLLFQVFSTKGAVAHEDAFIAIGYMITKMGSEFIRYAPYLEPPLINGLKSVEEAGLCTVSVGVVGDLCRALNRLISPFCDRIMHCLIELLQSSVLNRSVKPHVISVFADIAMAIEGDFERYSKIVMGILKQAGEVNITPNMDEDLVDYINTLKNSILEAYTGILQGLKAANKQDIVLNSLEIIVEFLKRSAEDPHRSGEVLKSAVGLLGDLGQIYGVKMQGTYNQSFVSNLINEAAHNGTESQEIANWARTVITQIQRMK